MNLNIEKAIEILERTPLIIENYLTGLSSTWTQCNEGENTWSAYDIVGHLVIGEKTDWMTRMQIILKEGGDKRFEPFNRFAQFEDSKGKTLGQLVKEFKELRESNIATLRSLNLKEASLQKKGIHPHFGEVTLAQLLSTWVVHDLGHISQISRVMAKHYKEDVGPWKEYLPILTTK